MHRLALRLPVVAAVTSALMLCTQGGADDAAPMVHETRKAVTTTGDVADSDAVTNLLPGTTFPKETWDFYSGKRDSQLEGTWRVETGGNDPAPVLVCTGQPYGYIRTRAEFSNFQFGLQWRYPEDDNGNSGILIYTSGDNKIWPTAFQVQLHQPAAGSVFPSGAAKSDNELRNELGDPAKDWNECVVTSINGRISVVINGKKVGEVTGCDPRRGSIALQSEGSEIHFRQIWLRSFDEPRTMGHLQNDRERPFRHFALSPRSESPIDCLVTDRRQAELRELLNVVYGNALATDPRHGNRRHRSGRAVVEQPPHVVPGPVRSAGRRRNRHMVD
ncbi:hypothetical protein Mal4_36120 [Maioricimonas rarisocia]|uniref:3-keto-alpha-glucoside-1,2-lyase/3-keto-2-hydroxy-glucal hydratase domain-containing protein n=1 Tax=Maioricimonas rarisocia TaxID=2528026 RepID=A0A517Z9W9_9PLAN|nr:DUF1080 domain-containing protein [Maioricimonas rarisocia]QDU39273.1 hypothetical protein Mal4_36120 [Maioricimonas rarisocia]